MHLNPFRNYFTCLSVAVDDSSVILKVNLGRWLDRKRTCFSSTVKEPDRFIFFSFS